MIKLSWDDAANEGIPQKSLMELISDVPFPDDTNAILHSIGLLVFMILQRFSSCCRAHLWGDSCWIKHVIIFNLWFLEIFLVMLSHWHPWDACNTWYLEISPRLLFVYGCNRSGVLPAALHSMTCTCSCLIAKDYILLHLYSIFQ